MPGTFFGLETAMRGLRAQQSSLNTTGHNIANANTPGYSRQRVDESATVPVEMPGMSHSTAPGQLGTGVQVDQITRLRDSFLDDQYRNQNQDLGRWNLRQGTLDKITAIVNEPSDTGISTVMSNFWNSWEKLSPNSDNLSARMQVKQNALTVTQTLNQTATQLNALDNDIKSSFQAKVDQLNGNLTQIAALNKQIDQVQLIGDKPNDLLDQRDYLVDQLSTLADVKSSVIGGQYTLSIGGQMILQDQTITPVTVDLSQSDPTKVLSVQVSSGELQGMIDSRLDVKNYHNQIDAFAYSLANGTMTIKIAGAMNVVGNPPTLPPNTYIIDSSGQHQSTIPASMVNGNVATIPKGTQMVVNGLNGLHHLGYSQNGPGGDFFASSAAGQTINAGNITIDASIVNDVSNIAAAFTTTAQSGSDPKTAVPGDGTLAITINNIKDTKLDFTGSGVSTALTGGSTDDFLQAVVGQLGVQGQEAKRQVINQQVLVQQVDGKRQSVSGVSMDEEMANMVKFQQSYNASARMITSIDQLLDKLINGTGMVGR